MKRMKPIFAALLGTMLPLVLLAGDAPPKRFNISVNPDPTIIVISTKNKEAYDTVLKENLAYEAHISGRCAEKWRLKSAKISRPDGTSYILPVDTDNRSISPDHGAASKPVAMISNYSKPDLATYNHFFSKSNPVSTPVQACNAELKRLVAGGADRAKLLREGFEFIAWKAYEVELEVWCQDDHLINKDADRRYTATTELNPRIRCAPTGYVPPQRTPVPDRAPEPPQRTPTPPPPLTSVSVAADPAETKGSACPVYVNFRGRITANAESSYATFGTKYRFVGDNGYKTDWIHVSVGRGETRTVHGRRFIQAPANAPGGTFIAPGGKPKIPLFNGWMLLEVMLPNGTKKSERENFTVDCNAQPPSGLKQKPAAGNE